MLYPCEKCGRSGSCYECVDWQRWFSVEYEAAARKVLDAASRVSYREIVFNTIFTRLWR